MRATSRMILAAGAAIALVSAAGSPAFAQNTPAAVNGAQQPTPRNIQLVPARATLQSTLDAKKAKQGEPVKAKLEADVQIPDEPSLPKNTVLEGHVDQVQASEHHSNSSLIVTFDQAKLKDGQVLPIKATVMAVSEPIMMADQGGGAAPAPMPSGGGAPMAGGGSQGGGAPQAGGSGGQSAPQPQPQPMDVPQAQSPQPQSRTHGVPGVSLQSDIHQSTSATFTSQGRNVHVPDGTLMALAITVVPRGVRLQ